MTDYGIVATPFAVAQVGGDAPLDEITEAAFDRIATINLRGVLTFAKSFSKRTRFRRDQIADWACRISAA